MNPSYASHDFLLAGAAGVKVESRFLERLDPDVAFLVLTLATEHGDASFALTPTQDGWFEVELLHDTRVAPVSPPMPPLPDDAPVDPAPVAEAPAVEPEPVAAAPAPVVEPGDEPGPDPVRRISISAAFDQAPPVVADVPADAPAAE